MKLFSRFVFPLFLVLFSANVLSASGNKHFPGIFLGATDFKDETNFTFGFEYEYRFDKEWGAGVVFERSNNAHDGDGVAVWVASAYYHPVPDVRLGVGLGQERIGGAHPHNEDLYRMSASYDFHFGSVGIAPTIAVDFIDGDEAIVFGIAIVKPF